MERLTEWNGDKYVLKQGRKSSGKSYWRMTTEKMAIYENIGEPKEIEEMIAAAKAGKIKVIVKHPKCKPMLCMIDNTLEEMQMIVGGHIESYTATPDTVIIGNENGRLLGLPWCCSFGSMDWVGTVIIAGTYLDEFADVPDYVADMCMKDDDWY